MNDTLPNDEQLEAMLTEFQPAPVRTELSDRIGRSLETVPDEASTSTATARWRIRPALSGAIAAGLLVGACLALIQSQHSSPPGRASDPVVYPVVNLESAAPPTLLAYHRAMRQSPEDLEALLDQPHRLRSQEPLSLRGDAFDFD